MSMSDTDEDYLKRLEHGNTNQRAIAFILRYSGIDGNHHKQWVFDQVLRMLAGAAYEVLIELAGDGWSEGIAP